MKIPAGIRIRHSRKCPAAKDREARCNCSPSYRAEVWDKSAGTKIRETFPTLAAADAWRTDKRSAVRRGTERAPTQTTLREAWEAWQIGAKDSTVRTRSGDLYKPSALRGYASSMRLHVLDDLGARKLSSITRLDLQDLADRLLADEHKPSTIRTRCCRCASSTVAPSSAARSRSTQPPDCGCRRCADDATGSPRRSRQPL